MRSIKSLDWTWKLTLFMVSSLSKKRCFYEASARTRGDVRAAVLNQPVLQASANFQAESREMIGPVAQALIFAEFHNVDPIRRADFTQDVVHVIFYRLLGQI